MKTASVADVKARLSSYLKASAISPVVVTRNGKAVAVLLGILVGVLPGLGAPNGVSLLLPLTFGMQPVSAIILLSSMYWGALFGGSVTSIVAAEKRYVEEGVCKDRRHDFFGAP